MRSPSVRGGLEEGEAAEAVQNASLLMRILDRMEA